MNLSFPELFEGTTNPDQVWVKKYIITVDLHNKTQSFDRTAEKP